MEEGGIYMCIIGLRRYSYASESDKGKPVLNPQHVRESSDKGKHHDQVDPQQPSQGSAPPPSSPGKWTLVIHRATSACLASRSPSWTTVKLMSHMLECRHV